MLAGLLALLAADAGHGAGFAGHRAALGIAAADLDLVLEEASQGDDLLGALFGADAAAGALAHVHLCHAVDHMDCVAGAGVFAVAVAQAAAGARPLAGKEAVGRSGCLACALAPASPAPAFLRHGTDAGRLWPEISGRMTS